MAVQVFVFKCLVFKVYFAGGLLKSCGILDQVKPVTKSTLVRMFYTFKNLNHPDNLQDLQVDI